MLEALAEERGLCKQETWSIHEKHRRSGIQRLQFVYSRKMKKQ